MDRKLALFLCLWLTSADGAEECRSLEVVKWILGEWTTSPTRVVIREHWHRVSDATFEGESTTMSVADSQIVNYETLRLVSMSDGVFYIAKVRENDLPVPFRLVRCSNSIAVFENPTHDAPQRLVYKLSDAAVTGDGPEMEVTLEGDGMKDFSLLFHRP